MISNFLMQKYLTQISLEEIASENNCYIIQNQISDLRPYWILNTGCDFVAGEDDDLTEVEWEQNELHLCGFESISDLLKQGLAVIGGLKHKMEQQYADVPFYLLLSLDEGDEDVAPSITIRFWSIRDGARYIEPTEDFLNRFAQPVLLEEVNLKG